MGTTQGDPLQVNSWLSRCKIDTVRPLGWGWWAACPARLIRRCRQLAIADSPESSNLGTAQSGMRDGGRSPENVMDCTEIRCKVPIRQSAHILRFYKEFKSSCDWWTTCGAFRLYPFE
ncbi:unnamed protein product [Urochloa humidicola]